MPRRKPLLRLFAAIIAITGSCLTGAQSPDNPAAQMEEVAASQGLSVPHVPGADPQVKRGEYLVGLLGCASCHTDGALLGEPNQDRALAGSRVGIAYTSPLQRQHPGVVYPRNLTPDPLTGLGGWSEQEIITLLRTGIGRHNARGPAVMPWTNYARLRYEDAAAIARYLQALPPVRHRVPDRVPPGTPARTPMVHVGLYRSR